MLEVTSDLTFWSGNLRLTDHVLILRPPFSNGLIQVQTKNKGEVGPSVILVVADKRTAATVFSIVASPLENALNVYVHPPPTLLPRRQGSPPRYRAWDNIPSEPFNTIHFNSRMAFGL